MVDLPTIRLAEFCRNIGADYLRFSWQGLRKPQKQWTCSIESYKPRVEAKATGFTPQKAFAKAVFEFLEKLEDNGESTETDS
jgi:hypothetical protein